jgi:hypothetical protein
MPLQLDISLYISQCNLYFLITQVYFYSILGCYNEVSNDDNARAFGAPGEYLNPYIIPETLTGPICLATCSGALAPEGKGNYTLAALENSRYVILVAQSNHI